MGGKKELPRIISTIDACETIKAAASAKDLDMYREINETGDFEKVKEFISIKILRNNEVISMKTLHDLYGLKTDVTRYRSKLKKRIQGLS